MHSVPLWIYLKALFQMAVLPSVIYSRHLISSNIASLDLVILQNLMNNRHIQIVKNKKQNAKPLFIAFDFLTCHTFDEI